MMDAEEDLDLEEEIASELGFLSNNTGQNSQPTSLGFVETDAETNENGDAGTSSSAKTYNSGTHTPTPLEASTCKADPKIKEEESTKSNASGLFSGDSADLLQPSVTCNTSQESPTSLFDSNTNNSFPISNPKTASNLFGNDSSDPFTAALASPQNEISDICVGSDSSLPVQSAPVTNGEASVSAPGLTSNLVTNPDEFNYTVQNFQQINSNAPELLHPDFLDSSKYHRNGGVTYTDQNTHMSVKEASPVAPHAPVALEPPVVVPQPQVAPQPQLAAQPQVAAHPQVPSQPQVAPQSTPDQVGPFNAPNVFNPAAAENFHTQNQSSAEIISQLGNMNINDKSENSPTYPQYQAPQQLNNQQLQMAFQSHQNNQLQYNQQSYQPNPQQYEAQQNSYQDQSYQQSFNNQQYSTAAPSASGPFIPDMYNTAKSSPEAPKFFVPEKPSTSTPAPPLFNDYNAQSRQYNQSQQQTGFSQSYDFSPNQGSVQKQEFVNGYHPETNGIDWLKNPGSWSEGAQKLKDGLKTAMDKVLTTLDPGMEEYLKPVINVGAASQDNSVLLGLKQGISNAYGVAVVKGQHTLSRVAAMPVGFESAQKGVNQMLEDLSYVNFQFQGHYIIVAAIPFVTELTTGSWSAMYCLGLKDLSRGLVLHGFSQPIPLPIEVVTTAYNRTKQYTAEEFTGYDVSIQEAVKIHVPYTKEQDWCSALTGVPAYQVISLAAQCLTSNYKKQVDSNPILQQQQQSSYYSSNYPSNNYQDNTNSYGGGQESFFLGIQ